MDGAWLWPSLALIVGVVLGIVAVRLWEGLQAASLRARAQQLVDDAKHEADRLRKDANLQIKEELLGKREQLERELDESRLELKERERRLERRERTVDNKLEATAEKERAIEKFEQRFQVRNDKLSEKEKLVEDAELRLLEELERVSGMTREVASKTILERLELQLEHEQAQIVERMINQTKQESEDKAREILTTAIQRVAVVHTPEVTASVVNLPKDEMKGRVIGREGRNIRAFEKATGVDVIVDDTPGVVVLSAFDGVRREVGRRAMERLLADGRIHPARIEEVVAACRKEVNKFVLDRGRRAVLDLDIPGVHERIVALLGRLYFRTSYGQNVLDHSIEVSHLCGTLAGELGLDVKLAKRCGLMHDVGKAVDHDMEGGHPELGADMLRRYREPAEVVNAAASHHNDVPQESLYAFVVMAGDAVSGGRPGARGESLERYIKRLTRLEEVASVFPGVRQAFAIQAGRELRVVINANKVTDKQAAKLARDIAKQVEQELTYPGEIKVTVLRETRVVEYAR